MYEVGIRKISRHQNNSKGGVRNLIEINKGRPKLDLTSAEDLNINLQIPSPNTRQSFILTYNPLEPLFSIVILIY